MIVSQDQKWQNLLEACPASHFVFLLDKNGKYLNLRVPDESRLWLPKSEHIGKTLEEVLPPELAEIRRFYFNRAVKTGQTQCYSYPHPLTPDRSMACCLKPIFGQLGVEEVFMTVWDVVIAPIGTSYVLPGAGADAA